MQQENEQMKYVKFTKEDKAIIMKSLEEQHFETFISYFRNTELLVECQYMLTHSLQKLAPTENAEFQVGNRHYYVKITDMIKIRINNEWAAFIKGHIYYRAQDVQNYKQDFPKLNECTSKDLFLTDQTEWFISTTFLQKIQVKPIDEYNILTIELNDEYYTRAEYNTQEQKFNPPISEWITYCFCKKLYNPREHYIQCNQCNQWVHYSCSDRSDKELKIISELKFICFQCVEENKNNKLNLQDNENQDGQLTKLNTTIQVNKKK